MILGISVEDFKLGPGKFSHGSTGVGVGVGVIEGAGVGVADKVGRIGRNGVAIAVGEVGTGVIVLGKDPSRVPHEASTIARVETASKCALNIPFLLKRLFLMGLLKCFSNFNTWCKYFHKKRAHP